MSDFKVCFLGVGSASPSLLHQPSCQIVDFRGKLFMIDCGEGAQLTMRRMGLKFSRLEHIFISHLHGDHFFGLPGLLSSMSLHDTGGDIIVHMPEEGVDWLKDTMDRFCTHRSFELIIDPISPEGGTVYSDDNLTVTAFPLTHRIPCTGFKFDVAAGTRRLRKDMIEWLDIPISMRQAIKQGADFTTTDGRHFDNERLTLPGTPSMSYAYCSDTIYNPENIRYVKPSYTVYHEATYLETEKLKAKDRYHSTAAEAVKFAVECGAKRLIIGHYSKSYKGTEGHLQEARSEALRLNSDIEIIAANEGDVIDLAPYKDNQSDYE